MIKVKRNTIISAGLFYFSFLFINLLPITSSADVKYPYITSSIPINGYATKLLIPENNPSLLYVLVKNDGKPKLTDKTGLYVFDISDVNIPRTVSFYPITSPFGFDMGRNGKTLYLYSAYFQGHDKNAWYGVKILDVSSPEKISEIGKVELDIYKSRLSIDEKYLFVSERNIRQKQHRDYMYSIIDVSDKSNPKLLIKTTKPYSRVYETLPQLDGKHLISNTSGRKILVHDISNPLTPKVIMEKSDFSFPQIIGTNGQLYAIDNGDLVILSSFPKMKEMGRLKGNFGSSKITYVSPDNKTLYIAGLDKTVYVVDVSNSGKPKITSQYVTPDFIGSVLPNQRSKKIIAGLIGKIAIIEPSKNNISAKRILMGHAEALREFNRKDHKYGFKRARKAINALKAAGITEVLKKKPADLSDKKLALILNDYGFFLSKAHKHNEAIEIYQKVIQLNPKRSVVYLNLGDSLRTQLPGAISFEEKHALTKKIKAAYLEYNKLSGRSTGDVDNFLSLNVVDKPIKDICEYVLTYTNQGRKREIFGSGKEVKMNKKDKGSVRINITSQGTAHMPWLRVYDNMSNEELNLNLYDQEDEDLRWIQNISVVPFYNGHHLLFYNDGDFLVASTPVGIANESGFSCGFTTVVKEVVTEAKDPELCNSALSGQLNYVPFDKTHGLTYKRLDRWSSHPGKMAMIDINNDGMKDNLVEIFYASGAGRGCDFTYIDMLNAYRNDIDSTKQRDLLMEAQSVNASSRGRTSVPSCSGGRFNIVKYKGKTYLEGKYREGSKQGQVDSQFHNIYLIDKNEINHMCKFGFKTINQ